jgi:hypothetical protein
VYHCKESSPYTKHLKNTVESNTRVNILIHENLYLATRFIPFYAGVVYRMRHAYTHHGTTLVPKKVSAQDKRTTRPPKSTLSTSAVPGQRISQLIAYWPKGHAPVYILWGYTGPATEAQIQQALQQMRD